MAYEQRLVEAARSLARIDKRKPRRANLSREADVDGGLIGGASLNGADFAAIVEAAEEFA